MADNDEQANLIVSAVNEASQTLNEIQKSFESFEGGAAKLGVTSVALGNILSNVLMKAFEGLKDMVRLGINEAIDAEQQQVKLAQAFRAEGDAADASVDSINRAAAALGDLIGVDNDVIVANAAMLRQLTGLSAEMINKVMPTIADLATRTGSFESAAMLVARAINGQAMSLQRMGIQMDLTNDKTKNLDIVMASLNDKFGGQAQANMTTTGGKLQNLKVVFTDIAQSIGQAVIESDAFQGAVSALTRMLVGIKTALDPEAGKRLQESLDKAARAARGLNTEVKEYAEGLNPALMKSSADREKAEVEAFREKTGMVDAELEQTLKTLEEEVAAREYALQQIQALNEKYKTDSSAPKFEQMSEDQIAFINQVQAATQQSGDTVRKYFADISDVVSLEVQVMTDLSLNALGYMTGVLPTLYGNMLNTTKSGLDKMHDFWHGFAQSVLAELNRILIKLIIIRAATAIFNAVGGVGGVADLMTNFMGYQTPEGSTRVIPGPPNMPVPIIAHGGETIGRGSAIAGGDTIVIQGDYFESEEANARLFDRVRRYGKDNGISIG